MAHVDLAKAEAQAIGGQIARVAGLVGGAIALVLFAITLLVVGLSLFLAEWLLGSMGWGILHGFELFIGIAIALVLLALGVGEGRLARHFALGLATAAVLATVLGLGLGNYLYAAIAKNFFPGLDPAWAPLIVGAVAGLIVGLVLGLVFAARVIRASGQMRARAREVGVRDEDLPAPATPVRVAVAFLLAGLIVGVVTAITFQIQVGIALGIAAGYATWIALMTIDIARTGIDAEALKLRFYPTQTIETGKETLEWLQTRMPPGRGS